MKALLKRNGAVSVALGLVAIVCFATLIATSGKQDLAFGAVRPLLAALALLALLGAVRFRKDIAS